jgi:hypothetical protein
MPGVKEIIGFINGLDSQHVVQHDRVMRRTYGGQKPGEATYALFWKDPLFSDGSTAPYIALDIHYVVGQQHSGNLGGIWIKGVQGLDVKPEQMGALGIPIANYLMAQNLSNPPPNPLELQDFDGDFHAIANRAHEDLDAYQNGNGRRRR